MKKQNDLKVCLVGEGFAPTPKMNEALGQLLGIAPAPSFLMDAALCLDHLESLCGLAICKPTLGGQWRAVFDMDGTLCATVSFRTEAHALAAALFHALLLSHQ